MITDKLSTSHIQLTSTKSSLFAASDGLIRFYPALNTESEPENISTFPSLTSLSVQNSIISVCGDTRLGIHNIEEIIAGTKDGSDCKLKIVYESGFKIMDSVFTPAGILLGDLGAKVALVDTEGNIIQETQVKGEVIGLSYNEKYDHFLISLADGGVFIYKLSNDLQLITQLGVNLVDKRVSLSEEMGLLPSDSDDENDSIDTRTETETETESYGDNRGISKLLKFTANKGKWNNNGKLLIVPGKDMKIWLFETDEILKGNIQPKLKLTHGSFITDVSFADNMIVSCGLDRYVCFWDLNGKLLVKKKLGFIGNQIDWLANKKVAIGGTTGELGILTEAEIKDFIFSNSKKSNHDKEGVSDDDSLAIPNNNELFGDEDDLGDDVNVDENDEDDDAHLDNPQSQDFDGFIVDEDEDEDENNDNRDIDENNQQNHGRPQSTQSDSTLTDDHNRHRKRQRSQYDQFTTASFRPGSTTQIQLKPYSTGSTPYHGNRRYLTITPLGCAYSVKPDSPLAEHKITVQFFDQSRRDYHFDDANGFDICSLTTAGCVFAMSGFANRNSKKPFETVVTFMRHNGVGAETAWSRKLTLSPGEYITSVCASSSPESIDDANNEEDELNNHIYVSTSSGFIKKFTFQGRMVDMWMLDPIIGTMSTPSYFFSVVYKGGYWFNIQTNSGFLIRHQSLPLVQGEMRNMFFSKDGDPVIVRGDGVLMVLTGWRGGEGMWKPLVDIHSAASKIGSGEVKAWPVALVKDEVIFIPFRGTEYPIFPLLSPMVMDVEVPVNYRAPKHKKGVTGSGNEEATNENLQDDDETETENAEEQYLRYSTLHSTLMDGINHQDVHDPDVEERLQEWNINKQKSLLLLFSEAIEESDADAAYGICLLMEQESLAYAQRIAERQEMSSLVRRILRLREQYEELDD